MLGFNSNIGYKWQTEKNNFHNGIVERGTAQIRKQNALPKQVSVFSTVWERIYVFKLLIQNRKNYQFESLPPASLRCKNSYGWLTPVGA
jgi:hypothetical protein